MRALALERDRRRARAPRLVADLAELATVNRVSDLCAEAFHVKLLDTRADFFVRRKSDRDRAAFDLRILFERVDHRHDFGDARFVVGTEQRRAVGGDDVVANQILQLGILCRRDHLRWIFRQHNVAALVILVKDRIDVFT